MTIYVNSEKLSQIIKNYVAFGLNESSSKKCKSLYILDSYYQYLQKNKKDLSKFKIYIFNLQSIKKAAESIGRAHKIRVIGTNE